MDVFFDIVPIALIVADIFTVSTDRQETTQRFDLIQRLFKFANQFFALLFAFFLFCNVPQNQAFSDDLGESVTQDCKPQLEFVLRLNLAEIDLNLIIIFRLKNFIQF